MAKRFTDSNKFRDPWYRSLSLVKKLIWEYMLCECDHAGIFKADFGLMGYCLGKKITRQDLAFLGRRISWISDEKLFIPKFIEFQYGDLRETSSMHRSVINILKKYNLLDLNNKITLPSLSLGRDKEKDIYKEKDKDKEKEYILNAKKVLNYLNSKTGKNLGSINIDPIIEPIIARLKNKYTVNDLMKIIDLKLEDPWYIENPKYYNPDTLFGSNKKVEKYLNETSDVSEQKWKDTMEEVRQINIQRDRKNGVPEDEIRRIYGTS